MATNGFANAAFLRAVGSLAELPPEGPPEVAFAGRSNVGKSSAINALLGRKSLARTSKTPGRTQTLNFYEADEAGAAVRLVDLPGYGFARVPLPLRDQWRSLVGGYLATRSSLCAIALIMDARHPLTPLDLQLVAWCAGAPLVVLLTKADKLSRSAQAQALRSVRDRLASAQVQLFSAATRQGVDAARDLLQDALRAGRQNKKPPVKGI